MEFKFFMEMESDETMLMNTLVESLNSKDKAKAIDALGVVADYFMDQGKHMGEYLMTMHNKKHLPILNMMYSSLRKVPGFHVKEWVVAKFEGMSYDIALIYNWNGSWGLEFHIDKILTRQQVDYWYEQLSSEAIPVIYDEGLFRLDS